MKLIVVIILLIANVEVFAIPGTYLPVPSQNLVRHTYYTLSYNDKNEEANWVYYTLTDNMVMNGGEERTNNFKVDVLVPTGSAKSSDYTKSGYDRGHLCPAGDMGFNPTAMVESFFMSNISPQKPDFNRGIWKELETAVRGWARKEHKIEVVTGPVFKENKGTIGKSGVLVPGYFFKIIFDSSDEPRIIAFLLPNEKSDRPIKDFAVTTDEIEKLTGYDFFSQLPDNAENQLEGQVELAGWFEGYTTEKPQAYQNLPQKKTADSDPRFYYALILVIILVAMFVYFKSRKRR